MALKILNGYNYNEVKLVPKNIKNHINNGEKKKELETPEKNNQILQ